MSTTGSAINVGKARAVVSRPTPPDDKTLIWHEQTQPTINPQIGILRVYSWVLNEWLALQPDASNLIKEVLTVTTNGEQIFTLSTNVVKPELSHVQIIPGALLSYGEHFVVTGNTLIFDSDNPFTLLVGDSIEIIYAY